MKCNNCFKQFPLKNFVSTNHFKHNDRDSK